MSAPQTVLDRPKYLERLELIDGALKSAAGLSPYEFARANRMSASTVYRYLGWIELRCGLIRTGRTYKYRGERTLL